MIQYKKVTYQIKDGKHNVISCKEEKIKTGGKFNNKIQETSKTA